MNRPPIASFRPKQYLLLLCSVLLLWPALLNRGPFFFNDTSAYVRAVDAAVFHATGVASDWTAPTPRAAPAATAPARAAATARTAPAVQPSPLEKPVLLGRSAYYGAILYLGVVLGSFWIVIALQAALAAALLLTLLRHFVDPARQRAFAFATLALFAVIALTPLPFFVCLLMPDLFTGLAVVAAVVVLNGWSRERAVVRIVLIATLALAALVHSSNVLIIAGLGIAIALWRILASWKQPKAFAALLPAGILLGCALVGITGEMAFSMAVTRITGQPPIRPPFITARFVDDGPGTAYLHAHCPDRKLLLCDYVERLPAPSDGFLWDADPHSGVFMAVSPARQRLLSAEQIPFVLASVAHAPGATVAMLARDFGQQLGKTRLVEFNYDPPERGFFEAKLPAGTLDRMQHSRAYAETMPIVPFETLSLGLTLAALALFAWSIRRAAPTAPWSPYAAVAVSGVLINDLICGCLSTPHDRYQMRVIWVLPAIAVLMLLAWHQRRSNRAPADRP